MLGSRAAWFSLCWRVLRLSLVVGWTPASAHLACEVGQGVGGLVMRIVALPILVATLLLAASPRSASALEFEVQSSADGQNFLILSGEFKASDDLREIEAALRAGKGAIVSFNSPGGNVYAAMEVGRLIRRLNLSTAQPRYQECASACSLAFLGGVQRYADPGAIGVHKSSFTPDIPMTAEEAVSAVQQGTADVIAYISEMGADPGLLALAFSYDSSDIRYLSGSEMAQFRVTTEPPLEDAASSPPASPPPSFQTPAEEAPKDGDELALAEFEREALQQGITILATIKEELPDEYEGFAREMMAITLAGDERYRKATALMDALRRKHSAQIQRAPDSAVSELLRSGADLLKAVQKRESDAVCAQVAYQGGAALDPNDRFYRDFYDREVTATFRAIGAGLRSTASPRKATDADWARVGKTYRGTRKQLRLAIDGDQKAAGYCKAAVLFYDMVLEARGPSGRRVRDDMAYLLASE